MTLTPRDFRVTMAVAVLDDLFHGQPELEYQAVQREGGKVYEVRGFISPAKLGAFGSQQLERVIEHNHPGLLAILNGDGPTAITEAELIEAMREAGVSAPMLPLAARAARALIAVRTPYRPGFEDA